MRDLSGLGSTTVLTLVTVSVVGYLALANASSAAVLLAASAITGSALASVLKWRYGRLRPDPAFADFVATGLSFPSSHATSSAVVYLTLGALFASTRTRLKERAYILSTAAAVAALVGVSRIALGVHWTTDVLGGWAIGAAWATLWLMVAHISASRSKPTAPPQG
jgi:undecaprenyl-diphosphatase